MGTIKDIFDLSTQLANSVHDRKVAAELNKIQSLTLQLQSEQASFHEKNMNLREELVIEKERNQELRQLIKKLENHLEVRGKIQYGKPSYWLIDGDQKDGPFCQRCYDVESKIVRLYGDDEGWWECKNCKSTYTDESYDPEGGAFNI